MIIQQPYQCQTCFKTNNIDIELTYCSETVDLIEDCYICCSPNTISFTVENQKIKYFKVTKTY